MTTFRLALYLGVGGVLSQFAQAQEVTTNSDVCAVNAFTVDLYSRVARREGNIFISPFVVHTALSMAYFGAGGETAVEMAKGLRLRRDSGHPEYRSLLNDLTISNSSTFELAVANGLFAQKGFQFAATFKEALDRDYGCILNDVDLTGWPGPFDQATAAVARKQINGWVAGQTHNRIQEVLPPSLPTPGTRLILASAIWFKGKWATPLRQSAYQGRTIPARQTGKHRRADDAPS
jgi:serpin B